MSEQNPTKPADVLPDTPEEQPDRVTIIDAYALADPPRDAWENFGDANPEHHGGLWVTYNGSRWSVYETVPATELIDREEIEQEIGEEVDFDDPGHQYVRDAAVDMSDIVTMSAEWTASMEREIDKLPRPHRTPPAAIVNGDMTKYVAHYAVGPQNHNKGPVADSRNSLIDGLVLEDSYADVLDYLGVEPAEGEL